MADLTAGLAFAADHAYAIRRLDIVGSIAELLLGAPFTREFESAGHYYRALTLNRFGRGDTAGAGALFERVADDASSRYRARAMLALGSTAFVVDDYKGAMSFYQDTMRILTCDRTYDPLTLFFTSRMAAVTRGMNGDHRGAVTDLEKLLPLARVAGAVQPPAYYDYLNNLAVELGELGRLEEARQASEIAIAAPFASAYPGWRETFDEIVAKQRRASRSSFAVLVRIEPPRSASGLVEPAPALTRKVEATNLLHLPPSQRQSEAETSVPPLRTKGRVINFQQWKAQTQTPAHLLPGKLTPENRATMTTGEKLIRLMDLISRDETDDEMIDRILDAVEAIVLDNASEKI